MSKPERVSSRGRALPWPLAFVAGVALALGVGYALVPEVEREAPPAAPVAPSEPLAIPPPAAPPPPPAASAPAASQPVEPFATLELARSDFPASGPVSVSLRLAEPSADAGPRPVRLVSVSDQRILETEGRLDDARSAATIEIDPDFLQPGPYLVEVKTTERSHFPLRRYVIVVR